MNTPVYCLGVGPGDPELITVKALRLLEDADIVAYPVSEEGTSFASRIVHSYLLDHQKLLPIPFMSQNGYLESAQKILHFIQQRRKIVVLCQGDPFLYGSFWYLFTYLKERVEVCVVPGITSASLCASVLGLPLAIKTDVLTLLPAVLPYPRLSAQIQSSDVSAIFKIGRHFEKIYHILDNLSLLQWATYIEYAGATQQKILPLHTVDPLDVPYFSMILVHRPGCSVNQVLHPPRTL